MLYFNKYVALTFWKGHNTMKRMKITALLLVTVLLLGLLAGCSKKAEPKAYEAPVRAFESMLNNADATWHDAVRAAVGDFCGDELTRIASLMIKTGITTDDIMTERMLGEYRAVYGYDCTFSFRIESAEAMDAAEIEHYREQLQHDSEFFADNLEKLRQEGAIDWESGQPLEETAEMEELCATLRDRLADAEISEGYVLNVIVTVSGGDLEKPEKGEDTWHMLCIDGVWVIGDVFDNNYVQ